VPLQEDVVGGSFYQVDLSMRKIGPPDVTIGLELLLVDPNQSNLRLAEPQPC
jgi:hypothetical protein